MRSTPIVALVLAVLGAFAAWRLGLPEGDARGAGVLGGVLLGAATALMAAGWQRHLTIHRPRLAIQAVGLGMLVKMMVMGASFLALYLVPALGERLDPAAFLVSFAVAALALLLSGTADLVKVLGLQGRSASSESPSSPERLPSAARPGATSSATR